MNRGLLCAVALLSCSSEESMMSSTEKTVDAASELDTGAVGGSAAENELLPDSLKGDSVMHIEIDPSDHEDVDTDASEVPEVLDQSFNLELSNLESEESSADSAFVAYFEGSQLWIEHRGANASCEEDWRGVTAYFEADVFYVDYDLQGLTGCVYAVSYALELGEILPDLVNNRLYRVEAGGDIQYAQYEPISVDYPD